MSKNKHFLFTPEGKHYLEICYETNGESTRVIAKKQNTSANVVYRALKFHHFKIRDKSQAQKLALDKGRSSHPTEGKKHTIATRNKIANKMKNVWDSLNPEEKEKKRQEAAERWATMPEDTKNAYNQKAVKQNLLAAKEGSKFEKILSGFLIASKIEVQTHKTHTMPDGSLEIDIFLPFDGICIEVDGRAHFEPVWGEEALKKRIETDSLKNALLLSQGFIVVRIQNNNKYLSNIRMKNFAEKFVTFIKEISKNPPLDRLIYLKVTEND